MKPSPPRSLQRRHRRSAARDQQV